MSYYTKIAHAVPHKDPEVRALATALLNTLQEAEASTGVMMEAVDVARKCLHRSIETGIAQAVFGEACAERIADDEILLDGGYDGPRPVAKRRRDRRRRAHT